MPDMIDVLLAKTISSPGKIDAYAKKAARAVSQASKAVAQAAEAAEKIDTTAEQINVASQEIEALAFGQETFIYKPIWGQGALYVNTEAIGEETETALDVNERYVRTGFLETAKGGIITVENGYDLDILYYSQKTGSSYQAQSDYFTDSYQEIDTDYPYMRLLLRNSEIYTSILPEEGNENVVIELNTALVAMINEKTDNSDFEALTARTEALEEEIHSFTPGGEGNISGEITAAQQGKITMVSDAQEITASNISENDIVEMQILLGLYKGNNVIGVEIDYVNKICSRVQEAINLAPGTDFDTYNMYGGRKNCIVNNAGEIVAFEGDANYTENGSLGQVMVYQPKFYYMRQILETSSTAQGERINKEVILLSDNKNVGFTIHPVFLDSNNNELDYVLFSAYEGCGYKPGTNTYLTRDEQTVNFSTDYLSSISGVKPITGVSQALTVENAELLAQNRGSNWHITNLEFESANQMLMLVEYASLDLQSTFYRGVVDIDYISGVNNSVLTGSTASFGSGSGQAEQSTMIINNSTTDYTQSGKCSIRYRGLENPYGNAWRFIRNVTIVGNGQNYGGIPKINNTSIEGKIPNSPSWVNYFIKSNAFPWAFLPIAGTGSNSAFIDDYIYVTNNLNGTHCLLAGGTRASKSNAGLFSYAADTGLNDYSFANSARLMFIPEADSSVYTTNYQKWQQI